MGCDETLSAVNLNKTLGGNLRGLSWKPVWHLIWALCIQYSLLFHLSFWQVSSINSTKLRRLSLFIENIEVLMISLIRLKDMHAWDVKRDQRVLRATSPQLQLYHDRQCDHSFTPKNQLDTLLFVRYIIRRPYGLVLLGLTAWKPLKRPNQVRLLVGRGVARSCTSTGTASEVINLASSSHSSCIRDIIKLFSFAWKPLQIVMPEREVALIESWMMNDLPSFTQHCRAYLEDYNEWAITI